MKFSIITNAIIGDPNEGVTTRSKVKDQIAMISQIEPKNVNEALEDESWIEAMREELDQFKKNEVWMLVEPPTKKSCDRSKVGIQKKKT